MTTVKIGRPSRPVSRPYGNFRSCAGKVQFAIEADALAEMLLQQTHRPHYRWTLYDCLWCDFIHIGRHAEATGHDQRCRSSCERRAVQAREFRRIEGTW